MLLGHHAEWIVEDYILSSGGLESGTLVPFANFGKIDWFNCEATAAPKVDYGSTTMFYPGDGTHINLRNNIMTLTSMTTSGKNMTVTYTEIGNQNKKCQISEQNKMDTRYDTARNKE